MSEDLDQKILVFYIGVLGLSQEEVIEYMNNAAIKLTPPEFEGIVIFLPSNTTESRVEMINPKYITKSELIKKHKLMMKELINNLNKQKNKNEEN